MGTILIKSKLKKVKEKLGDKKPIILSDRFYVPAKLVKQKHLDAFTCIVGKPCEDCNCQEPLECPAANMQQLKMFRDFKQGEYVGFNRGNIKKIKKVFKKVLLENPVVDNRSRVKMKHVIKFIGQLRPDQQKTVTKWLKKKYGLLKSPPRSGKTVMVADIVCKLKYRTLILVNQDELASQFYNTFMNINDDDIEFTDAPYKMKKTGKPLVKVATTLKDLENEDISVVIMTYQKFLRHKDSMGKWKDLFGLVWVDEVQQGNADGYSKVINKMNPRIRGACSATPKRKDGLHVIINHIIGPVTSVGVSQQLQCDAYFPFTGFEIPSFYRWDQLETSLVKSKARNKFIVKEIMKDADDGHYILVTSKRVKHIKELVQMLRDKGYAAHGYWGAVPNRKQVLADFKKGKIQILVAMRQMTQVGLDIPICTSMHITMPNNNQYNLEQEINRCRTPYTNLKICRPGSKSNKIYKTIKRKRKPKLVFYTDGGHKVCHALKAAFVKGAKKEKFDLIGISAGKSKNKNNEKLRFTKKGW